MVFSILVPPAVVLVAVTVKLCVPITLVDPDISPVAELRESPEGKPTAEKVPSPAVPENPTVYGIMAVSFLP